MKLKKSYNVIIESNGKFYTYDILPQLINEYKSIKKDKPVSFEEFKNMILNFSRYAWWGKCEYEIILVDWPCKRTEEKWDVFKQIKMNIDIITEIVMNICLKKKNENN